MIPTWLIVSVMLTCKHYAIIAVANIKQPEFRFSPEWTIRKGSDDGLYFCYEGYPKAILTSDGYFIHSCGKVGRWWEDYVPFSNYNVSR